MKRLISTAILTLLITAIVSGQPTPFPCDVLWSRMFNDSAVEIGPSWSNGDRTTFLVSTGNRNDQGILLELVDGRTVREAEPLGCTITEIQRLDILENSGKEIVATGRQNRLSFLMTLDSSYTLIRTDTIGRDWNEGDWTGQIKIRGLRWIGGEDSALVISRATSLSRYDNPIGQVRETGDLSVYSLRERAFIGSMETGAPLVDYWRQEEEDTERMFIGGNFLTGEYTEYSCSEYSSTQVSTMSIDLEPLRVRDVSSRSNPWHMREDGTFRTSITAVSVVNLPVRGAVGFIALADSLQDWLIAYSLPEIDSICAWELPEHVYDLETFDHFDVDEPLSYLLCFGHNQLILFDLKDFRLLDQAYASPFYRSVQIADFDGDGRTEMAGNATMGGTIKLIRPRILAAPDDENPIQPLSIYLAPPYPNPFNSSTSIRYSLPNPADVKLILIDYTGRTIRVIASGRQAAGYHAVTVDGSGLPAGVYIARLEAGESIRYAKLVCVK